VRNAFEEATFEFAAERRDARGIAHNRSEREFGGFAQADDARDVLGAGAKTTLMMAAIEKLAQASATANIVRANSFWSVELVAGDGEEIDPERADVDGNFSGGLHGVRVEVDVILSGDAADLFERLDCAELVVRVHDSD